MDYIENKYIGLISGRLRNYKRKSSNSYNFSCPICGDSETKRNRARGYIYTKVGKTLYHCHNCNITMGFDKFLKTIDYSLHSEYMLERLKESRSPDQVVFEDFISKMKKPVYLQNGPLKRLKKISQLSADHPAKIFISERMIPNKFHSKMFWCDRFFAWSNEVIPNKFNENALLYDEGRVIIPFLNKDNTMHAFQGRSIISSVDNNIRYITIVNDESYHRIWGLDEVDFSKKTYVFEGPFDATFLPNSIATAGGDLVSTVNGLPKENMVIVYDNEPRSFETKQKIDKCITNGYNVCIWPSNLEFKDVNDMILGGLSPDFIKYIIDKNTYKDLQAKVKLNMWSKM
jgi:transcription elongation factor Elf1